MHLLKPQAIPSVPLSQGPLTSLSENLSFRRLDSQAKVESGSAVDGRKEQGYHVEGRSGSVSSE